MRWQYTTAYYKIRAMNARINIVQGGTSAGKTYDIMAMIADMSFDCDNEIISTTTDTFPNLKRGAMRDFANNLRDMNWERFFKINKTDHTYTNIYTNTIIEFFSCDEMGALGARRDYLFVNEANRISYDTFTQLEVRTRKKIWLDFNPSNEFWVHTELLNRDDVSFIKVNYLDNEALEDSIIKSIEAHKGDGNNNWWRVYGLGEIGSLEGNVYEGWQVVPDIPQGFVLKRYGVDFGWNDPTTCIAVYENDSGDICFDQKLYQSKIATPMLIDTLKQYEDALFVCDSARPEIIAEMRNNGLRAIGCDKSSKSPDGKINNIAYGIQLVRERKIFFTEHSKDLEREFLTYAWRKKKSGEILDEPEDNNNHALDAIRYAILDMSKKPIVYADSIF